MRSKPIGALERRAFTLVELLVVIALILVIAAIGIMTIPLLQSQQKATQNASQIAAWLGNAKAIALRDQRPTGLRFVPDPDNPNFIREVYLIQTPDDFTGGTIQYANTASHLNPAPPDNSGLWIRIAGANFYGGFGGKNVLDHPVQDGDYLEINGGGLLYQIVQVGVTQPDGTVVSNNLLKLSRPAIDVEFNHQTTRYRIIRQPRRITGEDSLTLTGNVAIDYGMSRNLPPRQVNVAFGKPPQVVYEILFAPNGGVIGRGTVASDKIILWVRDSTKPNPTDNDPVLVSVQVRTGFIGTYEVDQTSGDPYSNARDPQAGGM
jgi:prepilin-type N-terminal cleavage/methylation domain-containing protein